MQGKGFQAGDREVNDNVFHFSFFLKSSMKLRAVTVIIKANNKEGALQHTLDNRKILNGQFNMRVWMEFLLKQSKLVLMQMKSIFSCRKF